MAKNITPLLMFSEAAEEAMHFYTALFPGSRIKRLERWGPGEPGTQGSVKRADLTIAGLELVFIDSTVKHEFGFTPAISLLVECEAEAELENVFERLSAGGSVLMPLADYGFSSRFGWVTDRYGVSWQLNLN